MGEVLWRKGTTNVEKVSDVVMGIFMSYNSKQTRHFKQVQHRSSHMKHHISHYDWQTDTTHTILLSFMYIVQVVDVNVESMLASVAPINSHLITCLR